MEKIIRLIKRLMEEAFHGRVVIHFCNGVPKKVETNAVTDL